MQDIVVARPTPPPSDPNMVRPTVSSGVVATSATNAVRTMFPALAEMTVPGYSGMLVETLEGNVVYESNSSALFNPASNTKTATAFAVFKSLGPEYRFATNVYTDGSIDRGTGTLNGNLYVSGKDPIFGFEHAVSIASELNRMGIYRIAGDLIVTDNFSLNFSTSPVNSARGLLLAMDASQRSAAATRVWLNYLAYSGRSSTTTGTPSVSVAGSSYVQGIPSTLQFLFTHESAPLKDILKAMMCFSNNFLSERLGDVIGGPYAVARFVQLNANISPLELSLQTASGLGYNRVSPNAMMKLLRAFRAELARYRMTFADVMPVAGLDRGTLEGRFNNDWVAGSVVGKTGTLGVTDSGVSALSGEINTKNGKLLFVIFNQRGGVQRFRAFQNSFVVTVQSLFGGPESLGYTPPSLDARLATSRITYGRSAGY